MGIWIRHIWLLGLFTHWDSLMMSSWLRIWTGARLSTFWSRSRKHLVILSSNVLTRSSRELDRELLVSPKWSAMLLLLLSIFLTLSKALFLGGLQPVVLPLSFPLWNSAACWKSLNSFHSSLGARGASALNSAILDSRHTTTAINSGGRFFAKKNLSLYTILCLLLLTLPSWKHPLLLRPSSGRNYHCAVIEAERNG